MSLDRPAGAASQDEIEPLISLLRATPGAHFLKKPFTPDALVREVREVLDG